MRALLIPAVPALSRADAVRHGLTLAGLVALVAFVWTDSGIDVRAYWGFSPAHPYASATLGEIGAFLYSPAAALALLPLHALPWTLARLVWIGLGLACLWWLGGRWALALVVAMPVAFELGAGNIHLLLAVAIVAGFRWPAAWAMVLLTKVTPGVGLLWFVVRREWRSLAIAIGATAAIAAVSYVIEPRWWPQWFGVLGSDAERYGQVATLFGLEVPIPSLPVRLVAAALLVAWGARTGRRWLVPVASMIALPAVWRTSLSMLVAVIPLVDAGWTGRQGSRRSAMAAWMARRASVSPVSSATSPLLPHLPADQP